MLSARAAALHALVALAKGRCERVRDVLDGFGLDAREQPLAYELAHGVLRRERLLEHVLGGLAYRGLPKDPALRCALRLGAYQLMFVSGMPTHAAVGETVALVRSNKGFANALLRRLAGLIELRAVSAGAANDEFALGPNRVLRLPQPLPEDEVERAAIVHSLPPWLVARWLAEFGAEAVERIGAAASAVPGVFLRAAHGVDAQELRTELAADGVISEPVNPPGFLRWTGGRSPFASATFRAGRFVAQDPTAWVAADALPCGPGDTVLDLCAAPGTKTVWLAGKVAPDGHVHAYDPDASRRYRIGENAARLRLEGVVTIAASVEDLPVVDGALIDAPCSNSGVLGRRVEVRQRLEPDTFRRMAVLQRHLLRQGLDLVRPGGHAVYSTCSIDREENEAVVESALGSDAELVRSQLTLPLAGAHDGGFHAVIRRR